jgi:hypothetical protein
MTARAGFWRMAMFYNYRLWIIVVAPVSYFVYKAMLAPPPHTVSPALWSAFGIAYFIGLGLGMIWLVLWIVLGKTRLSFPGGEQCR